VREHFFADPLLMIVRRRTDIIGNMRQGKGHGFPGPKSGTWGTRLDLLTCVREWLELEDKIPTPFTPYRAHEKQSPLSVASDTENHPDAF